LLFLQSDQNDLVLYAIANQFRINKVNREQVPEVLKSPGPNVLIILADDMGYRDLHSYGGVANTPNLDALAAKGLKFTNCYAGAPNCSPSRVSLLTGRIPARAGMYSYRPPGSVMHLPDKEITLAELLKSAGYQTAHFGLENN